MVGIEIPRVEWIEQRKRIVMSIRYDHQEEEKPPIKAGWLFIIILVILGLWWAIIYMSISWLWK